MPEAHEQSPRETARHCVSEMSRLHMLAVDLGLNAASTARLEAAVASSPQPPAVAAALLGLASEDRIVATCERLYEAPRWHGPSGPAVAPPEGLNVRFLDDRFAVFLADEPDGAVIGLVDPGDQETREALGFAVPGARFRTLPLSAWRASRPEAASFSDPRHTQAAVLDDVERLRDFARDTPVVRLTESLLEQAFLEGASDLHVEQRFDHAQVRFRIDGALRSGQTLDVGTAAALIARIKVLSDLDVAIRRAPQDGRTTVTVRGVPVDLRVSTTPIIHGESLVARLLHRRSVALRLSELGLNDAVVTCVEGMLAKEHGLVLVTGPTGSGKTTTLYAALQQLASGARKILTVEDPVEYVFEGVNQTQVNEAAGVSFATALRAFLRHDPDVILVGEIRDTETARLAVQAALTGHLVLATLHTNDAASAPARLIDMGVEPFLLGGVLLGAVAQRLLPTLCPSCARPRKLSREDRALLRALDMEPDGSGLREANGCAACGGTGRIGRRPIAEAFRVTRSCEEAISRNAPKSEMRAVFAEVATPSLAHEAARCVFAGGADLSEVWRVSSR